MSATRPHTRRVRGGYTASPVDSTGGPSIEARIGGRIKPDPETGCWLWTGPTTNGYGIVTIGTARHPAHRYVWALMNGLAVWEIGDYLLHHTCGTKHCVNPAHLERVKNWEHGKIHHDPDW